MYVDIVLEQKQKVRRENVFQPELLRLGKQNVWVVPNTKLKIRTYSFKEHSLTWKAMRNDIIPELFRQKVRLEPEPLFRKKCLSRAKHEI